MIERHSLIIPRVRGVKKLECHCKTDKIYGENSKAKGGKIQALCNVGLNEMNLHKN